MASTTTNELIFKSKVVFKVNYLPTDWDDLDVFEVFTIGSDEWRVKVMGEEGNLALYLSLVAHPALIAHPDVDNMHTLDIDDRTIDAQFVAYIRDADGRLVNMTEFDRHPIDDDGWGTDVFVKPTDITDQNKWFPNDTLTVCLHITVFKPLPIGPKKRCHFGDNFNDKNFNDCRLVVQQKEFFASKLVLSDRSKVFRQMFSSDMLEKKSGDVVIDDIKPEVFEQFLRFLYFGDSNKMNELSEQLLYVADKYMVDDLKIICQNLIYLEINAKNAFKILQSMDKYGNKELRTKTIEYIKSKGFESLSHQWHKIVGKNNGLVNELINGLATDSDDGEDQESTEIMFYSYWCGV